MDKANMRESSGRELLLLRHGKSDWSSFTTDFQRPLKNRGKRAAQRMRKWIVQHQLIPDLVITSPALRALITAEMICTAIDIDSSSIQRDERIYEAHMRLLLSVLADIPADIRRVLLVGHNPGLEDLVIHLAGNALPEEDKLMPTAALALFQMPDDWSELAVGCATLVSITRPGNLPKLPLNHGSGV